eukprot:486025-Prymnesium_polylepis.1
MAVEPAHIAVVFDALAESKSSVVNRDDADARLALWRTPDGGFDEEAFGGGLRKGLVTVLRAYVVLYFFVGCGVAVVGRVVLDAIGGSGG